MDDFPVRKDFVRLVIEYQDVIARADGNDGVRYNPEYIANKKNVLSEIAGGGQRFDGVIRVYDTTGMEV